MSTFQRIVDAIGRLLAHAAIFFTVLIGLGKIYGFWDDLIAWTRANKILTTLIISAAVLWWFVITELIISDKAAKFHSRSGCGKEDEQ